MLAPICGAVLYELPEIYLYFIFVNLKHVICNG